MNITTTNVGENINQPIFRGNFLAEANPAQESHDQLWEASSHLLINVFKNADLSVLRFSVIISDEFIIRSFLRLQFDCPS